MPAPKVSECDEIGPVRGKTGHFMPTACTPGSDAALIASLRRVHWCCPSRRQQAGRLEVLSANRTDTTHGAPKTTNRMTAQTCRIGSDPTLAASRMSNRRQCGGVL